MGTNTGIGIGIGIPFKNNALGGDKPYFPPELKARMIGVWTSYGKKNTDADRNIIKNKIPNAGGDLEILNSAYKLNSGFGEYKVDFLDWTINSPFINERTSFTFSSFNDTNNDIITVYQRVPAVVQSFKIKTKLRGRVLYRYYVNKGDTISVSYYEVKEGINILPDSVDPTSVNGKAGFVLKGLSSIKVEQIPSFEGAFVTDGINDLITSTKTVQEMGITDEITVVSMIHKISSDNNWSNLIGELKGNHTFVANRGINTDKTGIYGYTYNYNENAIVINNILGDKNDYIVKTSTSLGLDNKYYVTGFTSAGIIQNISQIAWYWTFIANRVLTTDEINQVIAYYNLDRTLRPDILCNITKQGITNDNHADFNDKLIDYSGNGRDIQMYNLAWKGGSGIAAKKFETIKDYNIIPDEGLQELTIYNEFSFKIKSIRYADRYWAVQSLNKTDMSYPVTIITDKDIIWRNTLNYTDADGVKGNVKKETNVPANTPTQVFIYGFNDFDISDDYTKVNCVAYATRKDITEFTVTFIPSCKGGLLLDGVNDFGQFVGDLGLKDYTLIMNRAYNNLINNQVPLISSNIVEDQTPFIVEHWNTGSNAISFSYGASRTTDIPLDINKKIVYQSTYSYMGYVIPKGNAISTGGGITLGKFGNGVQYSAICLWSLMLFPYSMSEFLIERQLKKHKLGTLYPDMVEFRPVIKSNVLLDAKPTFVIRGTSTYLNAGDYVPENSQIWVSIKMNNIADRITKFTVNGKTIDIPENAYSEVTLQYGFPFVIDKSPQKISITIEQDENYVKFEPVITNNVEYVRLDFYLNNYQKRINIGDYIPKDAYLRANLYLKNNVDELTVFTFNGVNIGYRRSSVDDTAFNINQIYNYDSPQEVDITIDEYIRYEDIVQPYPVLLRFNDENGNEVSWGDKIKVGSSITRIGSAADSNLLPNIYNIFGLLLNGNQVTSSKVIVEKTMVFKAKSAYIFDNNEPKCILSPRLLRIPNSSYKILGHIPDISGHGNHGKINNSAYAEGSGVNEDGSYQFDGVDDFVTIPTLSSGGKQVLMKVNWNTINSIIYDQRGSGGFAIYCSDYNNPSDSITVPAYKGRNAAGTTYIDGIRNEYIIASQLRNVTHNIVEILDTSYAAGNINPIIGKSYTNSNYGSLALYDFMLFDEISTDDKIKELNEYVGIEAKVELPPYYWDTYGKTNLDADKATIQQRGVAIGDYDLTNYNHVYEGMSGYNGYPIILSGTNRTYQDKASYVNVVEDDKNVINLTRISFNIAAIFSYVKQNGVLTSYNKDIESFKIKVTGIDYSRFVIKYSYISEANATAKTTMTIASDSIYELPKSFASDGSLTSSDIWIGINFTKQSNDIPDIIEDVNVTIEVLPEYENGLVYDGVEDYSENVNIPIVDDFTFLVKASLLKGFTGSGGLIARKGDVKHVTSGGYAFVYCLDSSLNKANRNSYYSFGKALLPSTGAIDPPLIGYMTKTSVNGVATTFGTNPDIKGINFGDWNGGRMSMVVYKSILYPKTIPLLQINFLKNLMEKDEIIDLTNPIFIKNE
jgi:hypothetical protein